MSVLRGYSGYLQADAYSVYDAIYKGGDVIEVGCMAHARRYFIEAEDSEPDLAKEAVRRFGELYGIERARGVRKSCARRSSGEEAEMT